MSARGSDTFRTQGNISSKHRAMLARKFEFWSNLVLTVKNTPDKLKLAIGFNSGGCTSWFRGGNLPRRPGP